MKKINLSNYNYQELKEYLDNHIGLPLRAEIEIKNYMNKLLIDGYEMLDKWINSKMFELSARQLKREGKAEVIICGGRERFTVDPLEALIKGNEILSRAEKKNIKI